MQTLKMMVTCYSPHLFKSISSGALVCRLRLPPSKKGNFLRTAPELSLALLQWWFWPLCQPCSEEYGTEIFKGGSEHKIARISMCANVFGVAYEIMFI